MKIYISGPMRGVPKNNFPVFDSITAHLRAFGYEAVSPAERDRAEGITEDTPVDDEKAKELLQRDLNDLEECDAIMLLPGWESSVGALRELSKAHELGLLVYKWEEFVPGTRGGKEVRVTDPVTGGQKGSKPERFDLIPTFPLESLARVYGHGAAKYADNNWRRGYKWSLSYAALQRHLSAFWSGDDLDEESKLPHLAHAAWHCFALLEFFASNLGTDDRWKE
jgi:hypothetical protein